MMNLQTDGKFYELEELVRVNCHDCVGCCDCCCEMGDTIVLDPYDVLMLRKATNRSLQQLIETGEVALGIVNGLILPHIQMQDKSKQCPFLNEHGRCSIHAMRPGMCRLFPLGRNYEDGHMNYILLTEECQKKNRSKVKVSQWIGIQPAKHYHEYVLRWHDFRKMVIGVFERADDRQIKEITMYILQTFFFAMDVQEEGFFEAITQKMNQIEKILN